MATRLQRAKWAWAAAALLLAGGAGLLHKPLNEIADRDTELGLQRQIARDHPGYVLLTVAPGSLRAPFVGYLWIRAEELKQAGRFYDAKQNADLICSLQPRFTGAWGFNAWNMAYNISSATHTREERWNWVSNGVRLLRDKGIPYNPKALNLYNELSWIIFHKIAGTSDDMHWYYKRRWAGQMHRLLGPPPYGSVDQVIDAFRPIAEAPLDKTPPPTDLPMPWAALIASLVAGLGGLIVLASPRFHSLPGLALVGALLVGGMLTFGLSLAAGSRARAGRTDLAGLPAEQRLLADPNVRDYVRRLAPLGVGLDRGLLDAYIRLSLEEVLENTRTAPPKPTTDRDKALSDLMNDPRLAGPRTKALAFVRAQILWNDYKMDPAWMLGLMEKYGPIDWRLVAPHSLYWSTYGLHVCQGTPLDSLDEIDTLNTVRHLLNSLKYLTWGGRLTYTEDPGDPHTPHVTMSIEPRFIPAMLQTYDAFSKRALTERPGGRPDHNALMDGHINYLVAVMQMLYPLGRRKTAQGLLDYIKTTYRKAGEEWDLPLEEFLLARHRRDGTPVHRYARAQINAALRHGYYLLLRGEAADFRDNLLYAQRVWRVARKGSLPRFRLEPLPTMQARAILDMLVRPRALGYDLTLEDRSRLYTHLAVPDAIRRNVFDVLARRLRPECRAKGVDFNKAFPEPPHMDEFRRQLRALQDPRGRL